MRSHAGLLAGVALTLLSASASASGFYLADLPAEHPTVGLRVLRPTFANDIELDGASGLYDLRLARPVARGANVFVELGFSVARGFRPAAGGPPRVGPAGGGWASLSGAGYARLQDTSAVLGVGVQLGNGTAGRRTATTLAVYVPMTSPEHDFAETVGLYGDFYNLHRTGTGGFGFYFDLANEWRPHDALSLQIEAGSQFQVSPQGTNSGTGVFHFGAGVEGRLAALALRVEYLDVLDLAHDYDRFLDAFTHLLAGGLRLDTGRVRPALFAQVPIDAQLGRILDSSVGVALELLPSWPEH